MNIGRITGLRICPACQQLKSFYKGDGNNRRFCITCSNRFTNWRKVIIRSAEWQALIALGNNVCVRCQLIRPLTLDHITPLTKGGGWHWDNLQPLCQACNNSKADNVIDYRTAAQINYAHTLPLFPFQNKDLTKS